MTQGPSLLVLMLALLAAHLAGMGAFLTVPVLAPAIAVETGLPASLAGFHTALVYGGALLSGPLTGPLVRRHGGVRVLQVGLLTIGVAIALAAIGQAWAFAASAFLAGLGHGPVTPGSSHLLAARTPPRRRALVFSLKQAGVPGGAMMVSVIAPAVALFGGWRAGVLAMSLVAFMIALALQPIRSALDAERDPRAGGGGLGAIGKEAAGSLALLRSDRALRRLTIMSCGYGVAQFCFLTFFVTYQVAVLGLPLAEAGIAMAVGQAAGIFGRIGWAVIADRIGARAPLVACGLLAALAGLVLAAAGPGWPTLAVVLAGMVMGATAVGWNGVMLAEAARIAAPGQVGSTTGALSFAFASTMLVAPPAFTGLIALTGGYAAGFLLCVVAVLIGAWSIGTGPRR